MLPPEDVAAQRVEERLRRVAARFPPSLRQRVSSLLMAAAEAILQLADLDLVRHESDAEAAGSHTLAVWEELAPVMAGTVQSVNGLARVAIEAFPPPPEKDLEASLDDAFGPSMVQEEAAPEEPKTPEQEIASLVSAVTAGLRADVTRLGERLRNPMVAADPWNLVSDLLEFRGRLRAGIGELIFQLALRVEEVERADVVPGYAADLEAAVLVRQATTNLAFLFRGHTKRVASSSDDRIQAALADAMKDVAAFVRTRALAALRTADKRIFLESRAALSAMVKAEEPRPREIKQASENLARFLDSMSVISRRENLRLHDRARLAEVGRRLEGATEYVGAGELGRARARLAEAVQVAQLLYGRDAHLDTWLRSLRHFPVEWLMDDEVEGEIERMGALLANVAQP